MKVKDLFCESISIGKTIENDGVRVHKYSGSIVVTDMSNAGKRGKKVREFTLYDIDDYRVERYPSDVETLDALEGFLATSKNYDAMLKAAKDFIKYADGSYSVSEREIKGVNVEQGKKEIENGNIRVVYSTTDFHIVNLRDKFNVPTMIPPIRGGKTDISKFYKLMSNEMQQKRIMRMDYNELKKFMNRNGIYFHEYMGMD